jgi:hypothetical protein
VIRTLFPISIETRKKGAGRGVLALFFLFMLPLSSCSILKDRPVQLMSDTAAALKAAKEVSADTISAEKYRKASEAFFQAQNEYRLKNFVIAEKYALRAKRYAEEAEFDAMNQGSNRISLLPPEIPVAPPPPSTYVPPEGELATEVMRRGTVGGGTTGGGATTPNTPSSAPNSFPTGFEDFAP